MEDVLSPPLSTHLRLFSPTELQSLLSGGGEGEGGWEEEEIKESLVCKHGYNKSSPQIAWLVRVLASFTQVGGWVGGWVFFFLNPSLPYHTAAAHSKTASFSSIQPTHLTQTPTKQEERKHFLMFVTGTPRLPIGGFAALRPLLTVVRKDVGVGGWVDGYLPSCSTCQVYLKLPAYSSEEVLREKLGQAMTLGKEYFALD